MLSVSLDVMLRTSRWETVLDLDTLTTSAAPATSACPVNCRRRSTEIEQGTDSSTGWDQYCENKKEYGTHDHDLGSFSQGVVWDAGCVVPIPDGYDSADAAPLMCAGATVWTVLSEYGVRPTDRVGVMGIGGLGHLAIKLASAMGCHVVVFSSSEAKREEAFSFGASEYHVFRAGEELKDCKPVNHLLLCGSANVDYSS